MTIDQFLVGVGWDMRAGSALKGRFGLKREIPLLWELILDKIIESRLADLLYLSDYSLTSSFRYLTIFA